MTDRPFSHAKWIWLDYITPWGISGPYKPDKIIGLQETEKNRWGLFRRKFTLPADWDPEKNAAVLTISVDSRYKLFLNNGQFVGRGIYRCNRHTWYYDEFEVGPILQPGENVICVLAQYFGEDMSWYEPYPHGRYPSRSLGKGGLIFECQARTASGVITIGSDKATRAHDCSAWAQDAPRINVGLPFIEIYDAREFPGDWLGVDFDDTDDSAWGHVLELDQTDLMPTLVLCDIPRLEERRVPAAKLVSAGKIQPYFDAQDIKDSHQPGETPLDFVQQIAMSGYKEEFPQVASGWDGKSKIEIILDGAPAGFVFDLGKTVSGFIFFEVETDAEGTLVEVAWSEKLDDARGRKFPYLTPYNVKWAMQHTCRLGVNAYEMFHWNGFRYLQLNLSTPSGTGKVTVRAVGVNLWMYPVKDVGDFRCSDSKMDQLYDTCKWTLRNCMHDGFEDCPSREQRQWVGDAYVEVMANFAAFGDTALVKKLIRQTAQSQRGDGLTEMATPGDSHIHGVLIPDYTLYWVSTLYQYYWYTGDAAFVIEILPSVLKALRWFAGYIDPVTGLLTRPPFWIFVDWSANDKWGACCPINAQLYCVLRQTIDLGTRVGWVAAVEGFRVIADKIAAGINRYLWDAGRGAYVDAVETDSEGNIVRKSAKVTYHANSLAVLYGIAPSERAASVTRRVFAQPYNKTYIQNRGPIWKDDTPTPYKEAEHVLLAEPFFMHHVHQALAKLGRHDQIMQFLRDGWGRMLDLGATTIWELWSPTGSLCHAWSATPAYDLATHCLGVQITAPGATSVVIAPHLMTLKWAEGVVATVKGPVMVRWEWDEIKKVLSLSYAAPATIQVDPRPPEISGRQARKVIDARPRAGWGALKQYHYA